MCIDLFGGGGSGLERSGLSYGRGGELTRRMGGATSYLFLSALALSHRPNIFLLAGNDDDTYRCFNDS